MVFKSFSFGANKRRKVQITELSFELRIIYETATASTSLSSHAVRTPAMENRAENSQMGPRAPGFARNRIALARPLLATHHRPLGPAPRAPAMRQHDRRRRHRLPPPPARPNRPPPDVVCFSTKPSVCIKGAEPSPRARNPPSARHCHRRARARRGPAASDPHCPSESRHHLPRHPLTLLDPNPLPHRRQSAAAPDQSHRRPPLSGPKVALELLILFPNFSLAAGKETRRNLAAFTLLCSVQSAQGPPLRRNESSGARSKDVHELKNYKPVNFKNL